MFKHINPRNLIIVLILLLAVWVLLYEKDRQWLKKIEGIGFWFPGSGKNQELGNESGRESFELTKEYLMDYVSENIAKISPVEPVSGGKWVASRFWFATIRDLYIEYDDGSNMRQILISVEGEREPLNYKVVGYFEPGDNGWKLKSGEDAMFGRKLDLYEFDENNKIWIKNN